MPEKFVYMSQQRAVFVIRNSTLCTMGICKAVRGIDVLQFPASSVTDNEYGIK
jgi:hypothetical protein